MGFKKENDSSKYPKVKLLLSNRKGQMVLPLLTSKKIKIVQRLLIKKNIDIRKRNITSLTNTRSTRIKSLKVSKCLIYSSRENLKLHFNKRKRKPKFLRIKT